MHPGPLSVFQNLLPMACKAFHGGVCGRTGDSEIGETARAWQQEWTQLYLFSSCLGQLDGLSDPFHLNRPHCACHSSQHSPVRGFQLGYRQATEGAVWYVIQTRLPLPNLCMAVSLLKGLVVFGQARKTVVVTSTKGGVAMVMSLMSVRSYWRSHFDGHGRSRALSI